MADKGRTATETVGTAQSRTLGLSIPDQIPPPDGNMFLDPRETSDWIAALPLANIGETARQVYTTLVDFNRFDIPILVRAKVVELFQRTASYVCRNLRRHYMEMGFPLSPKAWKTIILSRELNHELAISYKIIIERMLAGEAERFDRKLLVIALHRAIHFLSQVYLQACLSYSAPPPLLWKETNALFAFARRNNIHRVPVKMHNEDLVETSTIEDRYKALMLFAAATPSRLRQLHIVTVFRKTSEWAPETRLLGADEEIPGVGALNTNLSIDEQPIHNALRPPGVGRHVVVLDLDTLLQRLQKEIEQLPAAGSHRAHMDNNQISRSLLRQLMRSWLKPPERRYVRTQLHFSLQVLRGLASIHAYLIQELRSEAEDATPADLGALTLDLDDDSYQLSGVNQGKLLGRGTLNRSPQRRTASDIDEGRLLMGDSEARKPSPYIDGPSGGWQSDSSTKDDQSGGVEVTTMNESAGGYCIRWSAESRLPKVKIGDLVGIRRGSDEFGYSLAVVRWLNCISQTEVDVGLHVASVHVQAVNAYPAAAEGRVPLRRKADPIAGLLLDPPARTTRNGKPSVVIGNTAYTVGTYLWIEEPENGVLHLIRLSRVIDSSGAFVRFGFEFIDHRSKGERSEGGDRDEFESLWHSL